MHAESQRLGHENRLYGARVASPGRVHAMLSRKNVHVLSNTLWTTWLSVCEGRTARSYGTTTSTAPRKARSGALARGAAAEQRRVRGAAMPRTA